MFLMNLKRNLTVSTKLWRSTILVFFLVFCVENVTSNVLGNRNTCSTPGCKDAADLINKNIDQTENPCHDFYKFACGGFLNSNTIPDGEHHISQTSIAEDSINAQIKEILEEKVDPNEPRIFGLAKNYYKSCVDDSTSARQKNLESLKKIIKQLGGWPVLEGSNWKEDEFDVFETELKVRKIGYKPNRFVKLYAATDLSNTSRSLLYLSTPEIPVGSEILNSRGFFHDNIQAYYKYMLDIAVLFGAKRQTAEIYLRKVLDFEKMLTTETSKYATLLDYSNLRSIEDLYQIGNGKYPWLEYINNMTEPIVRFENNSLINVENPFYLKKVVQALDETSKKTIANYIIWKVILESVMYLPNEYREVALAFGKIKSIKLVVPKNVPRWKECVHSMSSDKENGMTVAVSSMYIRRYFQGGLKVQVESLVQTVVDAFKDTINKTSWMSDAVRALALKKLELIRHVVAYPDELLNNQIIDDYSRQLEIFPDDHFRNFLNLQRSHYEYQLSNLDKLTSVNLWEYLSDSTNVNAHYYMLENSFALLAGLLRPPLFNPEWPSYATFGSIGFIVGHEIMHAYNVNQVLNKGPGDLTGWMNDTSKYTFLNRAKCFIDQYSAYTDELTGEKLNPSMTINEDLADSSGLKIAYRAYRNWVKQHGEDQQLQTLQNYTNDQLFFASAVNFFCEKSTKNRRLDDLKTDGHTVHNYRVLGMFSNSEDFARAYNCPVGSRMNPVKKCTIWD